MLKRGWLLIAAGVGLLGCSSDSDSNGGPVDKCKEFAYTWCGHALACIVEVGGLPASEQSKQTDDCVRVLIATVNCEKAVSVSNQYDTCLTDVAAMPCSSWDVETSQLGTVTPPPSCQGVVTIGN
jgi:hypothetical protein